jgi:hypothetical protein
MSKSDHNKSLLPSNGPFFTVKRRKVVPHEFVLDAIAALSLDAPPSPYASANATPRTSNQPEKPWA